MTAAETLTKLPSRGHTTRFLGTSCGNGGCVAATVATSVVATAATFALGRTVSATVSVATAMGHTVSATVSVVVMGNTMMGLPQQVLIRVSRILTQKSQKLRNLRIVAAAPAEEAKAAEPPKKAAAAAEEPKAEEPAKEAAAPAEEAKSEEPAKEIAAVAAEPKPEEPCGWPRCAACAIRFSLLLPAKSAAVPAEEAKSEEPAKDPTEMSFDELFAMLD